MERKDLQKYLGNGVKNIVKNAVKSVFSAPRETAFVMRFSSVSAKASAKREKFEEQGEHIPPFLIASITSACNLHCKGCYSRQNNATSDVLPRTSSLPRNGTVSSQRPKNWASALYFLQEGSPSCAVTSWKRLLVTRI